MSVKLTQMGIDIDEELCQANMIRILDKARAARGLRSPGHGKLGLHPADPGFLLPRGCSTAYGAHCGVVIQSALRRSGAGHRRSDRAEGPGAALQGRLPRAPDGRVSRQGRRGPELRAADGAAAARGNYPGIATHDETIIEHARQFTRREQIEPERYEFQMLYGVRRDLQARLRQAGYNMRVYIPFGTQWYPYLMRRLAERPANIAFILGNLVRESVPGR